MAQLLRIANFNGTSEQWLSRNLSTDPKLLEYVPRTPDLSTLDFTAETMRDGGERFVTTRRNVTESARIMLQGTAAQDRAIIQHCETLFRKAEEWQRHRIGEPYYLFHTPDGYLSPHAGWRSEILSGRVDLARTTMNFGRWGAHVEVLVTWTRRYYWEDAVVTALTLTNSNDTGAAIDIVNDPASYNYVDIDGADIIGSIPSPAIVSLSSAVVGSNAFAVYVGANAWNTPGSFVHVVQAESPAVGVGSDEVDADASNGTRYDIPLTTTETDLATWVIDAATQVKLMAGRYVRLIGRFAIESDALPVPFGIRPKIKLGTGDVIWTGPEVIVTASYALRDLGVVPLPPYSLPFLEGSTLGNLQLTLSGRSLTGAATTLALDYIQFTPTDSYRVYEPRVYGLANGRRLVDDPTAGTLYQENTADTHGRSNVYLASGSPLLLSPGNDTRLIFLHTTADNLAAIDRILTVAVSYRPRRLTI